jgi:hypothetical protein
MHYSRTLALTTTTCLTLTRLAAITTSLTIFPLAARADDSGLFTGYPNNDPNYFPNGIAAFQPSGDGCLTASGEIVPCSMVTAADSPPPVGSTN